MLVKFLSYIASLIGTGRYKSILVLCAALVLSVGSIAMVASVLQNGAHAIVSNTSGGQSQSASQTNSSASTSLHGLNQKSTDTAPQSSAATTTPNSGSGNSPTNQSATTNSNSSATNVTLSSNTVSLASNNSSSELTASTSDNSNVSWSIAPASTNTDQGITATIDQGSDTASAMFHFQADQNATPGTYQFTLTAKDASRNLNLTKTVSVTITQ